MQRTIYTQKNKKIVTFWVTLAFTILEFLGPNIIFFFLFHPRFPYSVPGFILDVHYLAGCRDSNPSGCDCRQVFTSPWKKSTEVAVADLELLVPRPYTLPSVIFPPSILVFPGHPAMFEVYVVLPCAPLLPNPHSPK